MQRLRSLIVLSSCLALVGGGCFQVSPRVVQAPSDSQGETEIAPIAVLALNGGAATITRGDDTVAAENDLEILPGDTVTVTSGSVKLIYQDAGASELSEGTTVTILPDGEGDGSVFAQIELAAGGIWTRFERLLGPEEKFSVSGNGVVATVRGTAFGVELANGSADVQVAESNVDVSVLEARKDVKLAAKAFQLKSGEGIRIGADSLKRLEIAGAKRLIRKLGNVEKQKKGYQFASKKLSDDLLKRKATTKLKALPDIPLQYRDRIDPKTLERILQYRELQMNSGFIAPTRAVFTAEIAPTTTPSN